MAGALRRAGAADAADIADSTPLSTLGASALLPS
jgi:hypothetical protein